MNLIERGMKERLIKIILPAMAVAISLFVAEMTLRLSEYVKPIESGWGWSKSPLRQLQPPSAESQVNQLGLRGKNITYNIDDFVIVILGDSQVEAAAVGYDQIPENVLQKKLLDKGVKAKVFSLASSGWGQDQQLVALSKYFKNWRANLILVWATPGNDFWENTFPDRSLTKEAGHIKPTYLYANGLVGPFYEHDFYLHDSALWQLAYIALSKKSANSAVLEEWINKINTSATVEPLSNDKPCEGLEDISQSIFSRDIFDLSPRARYAISTEDDVENSRSSFSQYISPPGRYDDYGKKLSKSLYAEIKALSHSKNADFRVFYPVRQETALYGKIGCVKSNGKEYAYNPDVVGVLKQTVNDTDLLLFDIAGKNEISVSKDDRHLNASGIDRVADMLSEWIYREFKHS